jgi:hypothetical protein
MAYVTASGKGERKSIMTDKGVATDFDDLELLA